MQLDLSFFLPVLAASFAAAVLVRFTFAAYTSPRSRSSLRSSTMEASLPAEIAQRSSQIRYASAGRRTTDAAIAR